MYRNVKQFKGTGNVSDKHAKRCKGGASVPEEEIGGAARKIITRNQENVCDVYRSKLGSQPELHEKSVLMTCLCFRRKFI
jgi:hypothetical protein